jgi:ABC-2 type transport system permease protein
MTNLFIRFVSHFRTFYESSGVDFDQFVSILRVKLTMDNRRSNVMSFKGMNPNKPINSAFSNTLIILAFMGFFLSVFIFIFPNVLMGMSVFNGILMVVTMMIFVSDFSSVLLDTTDNFILLPRPVSGRTLFAARMTHIFLYLMSITYAIAATSIVVVAFKFGLLSSLIYFLIIPFNTLFTVIISSFFYLLIIRFSSEEKLKDIINGFQILMMIVLVGFTQIMPHFSKIDTAFDYDFVLKWSHIFIPPMWFAGAIDTLSNFKFDQIHLVLTGLCVFFPLFGLFLINKFFSNFFSTKLSSFSNDSPSFTKKSSTATTPSVPCLPAGRFKPSRGIVYQLAKWFTSKGEERSVFYLVWHLVLRDRKLKLKLYPQMAYLGVMLVMTVLNVHEKDKTIQDNLTELVATGGGNFFLIFAYFTNLSLSTCISLIPYSDDFKAAWVYYALPVKKPGEVIVGSIKAIIFKVYTPVFIFISTLILFAWGIKALDDLILVYINSLIISILTSKWDKNHLPFSEEHSIQQQGGGNFGMIFLMMIFVGVIGGGHFLMALYIPWLVPVMIPIMASALYFLVKDYRNMSWRNFETIEV